MINRKFFIGTTFFALLSIFILALPAYAIKKKVVWVDAYHAGLSWSDGIRKGIESVLNPRIKSGDIELKIIHMDTKNNPGDKFGKAAGQRAKKEIEAYRPDVVIACDDASAKFLIQPFYAKGKIPVVFCGVNFDASKYGLPSDNVTGMIEVPPVDIALNAAKTYTKIDKIGYITFDDLSEKGNVDGIRKVFKIKLPESNIRYVDTMNEWKNAYSDLQKKMDVIIMGSANFMQGWNWKEAREFIRNNTKKAIPITYNSWTIDISLLAYSKRATEQGEWSAKAALQILDGKSPKDIPVSKNKEGDLFLNKTLADKLGIKFSKKHLADGTLLKKPKN